jgi:uncharacterized membrane protein
MILKSIKFLVIFLGLIIAINQLTSVSNNLVLSSPSENFSNKISLDSCKSSFFGLEPWYEFLRTYGSNCNVCFNIIPGSAQSSNSNCSSRTNSIVLVIMAIIDDLLRIAGFVSVIFIIVAGFQYVGSQGNPEKAAKAQQTILYAIIGLIIAISAIVLVTYIGNNLAK